jgi:replicative DNA helicase
VSESKSKTKDEITYDPTNERIVIGMALADRKRRDTLTRTIAADEFLVPQHAALWRALRVMTDKGLEHDPAVFLRIALAESPDLDADYTSGLEAQATIPTNPDWYVETLRWDATRARVIKGPAPELIKDLRDPKATPEKVASAARAVLRAIEGGGGRSFIRRPDELARSFSAEIEARKASGNFWPTGFDAMDAKLVEGAMPKRTAVVAGLPGSGKSTFSGDFAIRLAKAGRRPLVGCWEMGAESTLDVMVSGLLGLELERVVQGNLTSDEVARVNKATRWITQRVKFMENAFFGDELRRGAGKRSNDRSLDVLEGYIAESGCDVGIWDLWERCLVDLSYDGVTTALYRQQEMHARYNIYGVICHQLRLKDVEKRADKRPTREAIKGTGAFVEVADQIFGVHRDAQFKAVPDDSLEIICLKQRKGKANWAARFEWDGARAQITGGEEVPYDPGLESSTQFGGDIGDVKIERSSRKKPSRRDG